METASMSWLRHGNGQRNSDTTIVRIVSQEDKDGATSPMGKREQGTSKGIR